jgi:hypothetical protein
MFNSCDAIKQSNSLMAYELCLFFTYSYAGFELYFNYTYNTNLKDYIVILEMSEDNFSKYIASLDPTLFSIYHPEFGYIKKTGQANAVLQFSADIHYFLLDKIETYSLDTPVSIALQCYLLLFFLMIFCAFFLSFFTGSYKEENKNDMELTSATLSVEAEKELVAIDDSIYFFLVLLFFFGIYFGIIAFSYNTSISDFSFTF